MKIALFALFSLLLSTRLFAQKIEISAQANSGLFHYAGNSTASTSFINGGPGDAPNYNYTNNPYGNKNGFSYGGYIQAQYVTKSGFIIGLQGGYEVLRSNIDISYYQPDEEYLFPFTGNSISAPVKGQTSLQNQDININPYIGYRFQIKKIKIDLMPGIDIGINTSLYDKGKVTATDGTVYTVDDKLLKAPTDVRLRFGIAAWFKRFGLTAGYAHGLTNFASNTDMNAGGAPTTAANAHSELIRFGISYRIF